MFIGDNVWSFEYIVINTMLIYVYIYTYDGKLY